MNRIVIIGASSGIGRLIALDYARRGWRVGVAARRYDMLKEIQSQFPDTVVCAAIDVTADDATYQFKTLVDKLGGMDIVLYAAGCGWYNPQLDHADQMRTIDVNVKGFTTIVDSAYAYFKNTGHGHIAAITSIAGTRGIGVSTSYAASKRYQWNYLQAVEQLANHDGIKLLVSDIRPGFIRTDLLNRGPQHLPMTMNADYAAKQISRAIIRGKRVTVIDRRWAFVTALWRLIPRCLWRKLPTDKVFRM